LQVILGGSEVHHDTTTYVYQENVEE